MERFFGNLSCDVKYSVLTFIVFSSPKEDDSEDTAKPANVSPNRDWIPPEDQNQAKKFCKF